MAADTTGSDGAPSCNCPYVGSYSPPPALSFMGSAEEAFVRGGASFVESPADPVDKAHTTPDDGPADKPRSAQAGGPAPASTTDDWGRPMPPTESAPEFDGSTPSVVGGRERDKLAPIKVLKDLTTNTCECSENVKRAPGEPCSSARVVAAIGKFIQNTGGGATAAKDGEVVREAAKVLGCTSESCVVAHPKFRQFVSSEGAELQGVNVLDLELQRRFKPSGPRNSTRLLSNFNIDEVLQQWAVAFPAFFNFGFNMMDFEVVGGSLARTDLAGIVQGREVQNLGPAGGNVRRPCDTFACVLNTDVSTGRGKHWVAIFGDCRGTSTWSIEYFNSAGNPPPPPVTRWLESAASRLMTFRAAHPRDYGTGLVEGVPLTSVRHQDSQTECGLYALYFIRRRLEGAPYEEFRSARIPDDAMTEFRRHVFREGD